MAGNGNTSAPGSPSEVTPLTFEQKAALWSDADNQRKYWAAREMELRLELVKHSNTEKEKGTEYLPLPNDWRLKIVKTQNFKLDPDKTEDALDHFSEDMARLLVKWEPKLSVSNFESLSDEDKAFFADALTTKPGAPQLELVPPKVGK